MQSYTGLTPYSSGLSKAWSQVRQRSEAPTEAGADSLNLPTAYPLQQAIIQHPAKFKVIACGRQVGKTMLCALDSRERLLAGQRKLYTSTSQKQTDQFWEYIKLFTSDLDVYKNESRRIMRYRDGLLDVQTASDPDSLRSGHYHHIDFDECAYLDSRVWSQVGIAMLLRYDGSASFWSTPKRRNWYFLHFNKAQASQQSGDSDWAVWNFSTLENPYLPEAALNRLIENMTEEDYHQEILAQFLEGQGAVFRHVDEQCVLPKREPYIGQFVAGIDFAQTQDYTVIIVMDSQTRQVVDYDRFRQTDWALQRGKIATMHERWKLQTIIAERNSAGSPNIEALQREGLPVIAFDTTASSKPPLIESLVLAFDRAEIGVLNDPIIKGELMAYERNVTATGRSQYSAPSGLHDDCVMALALAWYGISSPIGDFITLDW